MTRTVYVNGAYVPETEAKISIFDRGFLMADGVYEVTSVLDGKLIDFDGHAVRLERSMTELDMVAPQMTGISCSLIPKERPARWCCLPRTSRGWPTTRWPKRASG